MDGTAGGCHRWRFLVPVIVGGCQDQQQGRRLSSLVNDGGALHRWRSCWFLVPVIVGGCQDQQQGRRLSSLVNDGGAVVLSMSAAGGAELCTMIARRAGVSLVSMSAAGGAGIIHAQPDRGQA